MLQILLTSVSFICYFFLGLLYSTKNKTANFSVCTFGVLGNFVLSLATLFIEQLASSCRILSVVTRPINGMVSEIMEEERVCKIGCLSADLVLHLLAFNACASPLLGPARWQY